MYLRPAVRFALATLFLLYFLPATPAYAQSTPDVTRMQGDESRWDSRFGAYTFRRVVDVVLEGSEAFLTGPFLLDDQEALPAVVRTTPGAPHVEPLLKSADGGWFETLALSDTLLYVGGRFDLGDGRKNVAAWERRTASWRSLGEGLDESVREIAIGAAGRLYAVSNFTRNQHAPWIVRLHAWDGSGWTVLGDEFEGWVYDMAVFESNVYVAIHRQLDSEVIYEIKHFNGAEWRTIADVNGIVYALAAHMGGLYAGGRLDGVGGTAANGVARWDGVRWESIGELSRHDRVLALTVENGRVFASGDLRTYTGDGLGNVIMWDGSSWAPAGTGTNGSVDRLAVSGDVLAAAGDFNVAGPVVAHNAAVFDIRSGEWMPMKASDAGGIRGDVNALAVGSSGEIYAAGRFSTAGSAVARNVARWDGQAWSALGGGIGGAVRSLKIHEETLYAGFDLRYATDSISGLVRWDDAEQVWAPVVPDLEGQMIHQTYAMTSAGGKLLVGARLSEWSGDTAAGLLSWNGEHWSILGDSAFVEALAVDESGAVYAGGYFATISGTPARNVARWDGSSWSALGDGLESSVSALAVSGGNVYAATHSPHLHIWHEKTNTWMRSESTLQSPSNCDTAIYALAARGDTVFAGGGAGACSTGEAGGSLQGLARWTPEGWSLPGGGIDGTVRALTLDGRDLYVGGGFERAGSQSSMNVARLRLDVDLPVERSDAADPFHLDQNYPNPFSSTTSISFTLDRPVTDIELIVYDLLGREVGSLARGPMEAGAHTVDFEAARLPAGMYLYRLSMDGAMEGRRMIVVR